MTADRSANPRLTPPCSVRRRGLPACPGSLWVGMVAALATPVSGNRAHRRRRTSTVGGRTGAPPWLVVALPGEPYRRRPNRMVGSGRSLDRVADPRGHGDPFRHLPAHHGVPPSDTLAAAAAARSQQNERYVRPPRTVTVSYVPHVLPVRPLVLPRTGTSGQIAGGPATGDRGPGWRALLVAAFGRPPSVDGLNHRFVVGGCRRVVVGVAAVTGTDDVGRPRR